MDPVSKSINNKLYTEILTVHHWLEKIIQTMIINNLILKIITTTTITAAEMMEIMSLLIWEIAIQTIEF